VNDPFDKLSHRGSLILDRKGRSGDMSPRYESGDDAARRYYIQLLRK
jgi:hypothetical protein